MHSKELDRILGPIFEQEGNSVLQVSANLLFLEVVFGRLVVLSILVLVLHALVLGPMVKIGSHFKLLEINNYSSSTIIKNKLEMADPEEDDDLQQQFREIYEQFD